MTGKAELAKPVWEVDANDLLELRAGGGEWEVLYGMIRVSLHMGCGKFGYVATAR